MKSLFINFLKIKLWKKYFGKPIKVKKSWEDTPKNIDNMVKFLNWFDATDSVNNTVAQASMDWKHRFTSYSYFEKINKKNALEIGFGGGRLLAQSAKCFKHVYGIDIHRNFLMTNKFLTSQGIKNFSLLHRDDMNELTDNSIDFIYSFIVFQHFDSLNEVEFYLQNIKRLLNRRGIAHIYFGKNKNDGVEVTSDKEFILRDCSLFINPKIMRSMIEKQFEIIDFKDNLTKNLNTNSGESVQAMIVFKNN
jgi:ubiquinone/menaquinone biosynthesis C-methylase UbiE